jgi:hypothetical protein
MKIKTLIIINILPLLCGVIFAEHIPPQIDMNLKRIKGTLDTSGQNTYRIELTIMPSDIYIDPPPSPESFKGDRSVYILIETSLLGNYIDNLFAVFRKSEWEPSPRLGYARWRFRILGAWEKPFMDIVISKDGNMLKCNGIWYFVDEELINALSTELLNAIMSRISETGKP